MNITFSLLWGRLDLKKKINASLPKYYSELFEYVVTLSASKEREKYEFKFIMQKANQIKMKRKPLIKVSLLQNDMVVIPLQMSNVG